MLETGADIDLDQLSRIPGVQQTLSYVLNTEAFWPRITSHQYALYVFFEDDSYEIRIADDNRV